MPGRVLWRMAFPLVVLFYAAVTSGQQSVIDVHGNVSATVSASSGRLQWAYLWSMFQWALSWKRRRRVSTRLWPQRGSSPWRPSSRDRRSSLPFLRGRTISVKLVLSWSSLLTMLIEVSGKYQVFLFNIYLFILELEQFNHLSHL